jgi:hypothetical protein
MVLVLVVGLPLVFTATGRCWPRSSGSPCGATARLATVVGEPVDVDR